VTTPQPISPPALARPLLRPLLLALTVAGFMVSCGGADSDSKGGGNVVATEFDGAKAKANVQRFHDFGPRVPGTPAHVAAGDWLLSESRRLADTVIVQSWVHTTADGKKLPMRNILARFKPTEARRVLYLAHWDSRPRSDSDAVEANRSKPVPGANDGGSGIAILLGVAEALKARPLASGVDLLFVDGEDWGDFPSRTDVLIGSTYFAANLPDSGYAPLFGVLFDMVGDAEPRFQQETHSIRAAPEVVRRVWTTAQRLGHAAAFQNVEYGEITDDHLPLIAKGLRVIDVIDLYFPWHHTTEDTPDKVSQATLQMVGDVAMAVLRELP
jgi:glutaminyl-peptide cyclotransferase